MNWKKTAMALIIALLMTAGTASAAAPQLISVQGRLTDTSDSPVTSATQFNFSIYNASTGGKMLWNETKTITPDSEGKFSTYLGSITPLALPFDKPYYLEVKIEGDLLDPRYSMTSVPYSLNAAGASEPNYCKRTSATTNGDITYGVLRGIPAADAICEGEFGTGWHFAKTDEDFLKIIKTPPSLYEYTDLIDNAGNRESWIHRPASSDNCINPATLRPWESSAAVIDGNRLRPTSGWEFLPIQCGMAFYRLWCCPP